MTTVVCCASAELLRKSLYTVGPSRNKVALEALAREDAQYKSTSYITFHLRRNAPPLSITAGGRMAMPR